jgi:hypothetical protein
MYPTRGLTNFLAGLSIDHSGSTGQEICHPVAHPPQEKTELATGCLLLRYVPTRLYVIRRGGCGEGPRTDGIIQLHLL